MTCSQEFQEVFERGRSFYTPYLRVHYRKNNRERSRLGLVVTRRLGKAVLRNRVKRLLREVFRRNKMRLSVPLDVVLVPQREARAHGEYLEAFLQFLEKVEKVGGAGKGAAS
jgi:ribonuclease P protein component